jgi:hypothetical protein
MFIKWFSEMFSTPLQLLQKFIVTQGTYFKGNLAYIIVFFVLLRNKVIPGTF